MELTCRGPFAALIYCPSQWPHPTTIAVNTYTISMRTYPTEERNSKHELHYHGWLLENGIASMPVVDDANRQWHESVERTRVESGGRMSGQSVETDVAEAEEQLQEVIDLDDHETNPETDSADRYDATTPRMSSFSVRHVINTNLFCRLSHELTC